MYAYIKGVLEEIHERSVVIDVGGIGYSISVPGSVISGLPQQGEKIKLFTYMHLREDMQDLYGFIEKEEKEFFIKLISVSGIGPKVALNMLSVYNGMQLVGAILTEDIKLLSTVPGIGKKTAGRLVLELRDKVDSTALNFRTSSTPLPRGSIHFEALEALQGLGYSAVDAENALKGIEGQDAAELIKWALKNLDSSRR
ncbi:MAG TPA: Holliday junction branch migration protein RuvA [Bacillota bacterium]|nr:Holliday junction branch migration protein RuvA [Bacillota bacterium]